MKDKLQSYIYTGVVILFLIGGIVFVQKGKNRATKQREYLNQSGTLGVATFAGRSRKKGRTEYVVFEYFVNDEKYKMSDFYCPRDSREAADAFNYKAKIKDKFIVLYDGENPKESIIRLDYPVGDSTDFKMYEKQFERVRWQKAKE